jgi:uncharacterized membrane protein YdbT with pleckstrin-like domain
MQGLGLWCSWWQKRLQEYNLYISLPGGCGFARASVRDALSQTLGSLLAGLFSQWLYVSS